MSTKLGQDLTRSESENGLKRNERFAIMNGKAPIMSNLTLKGSIKLPRFQ